MGKIKLNKYIGNGLALYETEKGTLVWRVKFRFDGRESSMSLGESSLIDETEAIHRAFEVKQLVAQGLDPRIHRTWVRPVKQFAREYLLQSIEQKVKEIMETIEIMKNQG